MYSSIKSSKINSLVCKWTTKQLCSSVPLPVKGEKSKAFFVGFFAGALGSLVGLGGAFVIIPYLAGPLKLTQHLAHGTSMASVAAASFGACVNYAAHHWNVAKTAVTANTPRIDFGSVVCIALTAGYASKRGGLFA